VFVDVIGDGDGAALVVDAERADNLGGPVVRVRPARDAVGAVARVESQVRVEPADAQVVRREAERRALDGDDLAVRLDGDVLRVDAGERAVDLLDRAAPGRCA